MDQRTEFEVSGGDISHAHPMKVEYLAFWSPAMRTNISMTIEKDRPFHKDPEKAVLVIHIDQAAEVHIIDGFGDTHKLEVE